MPEIIIPPGYLQARYRYRLTNDPEEMIITCGHTVSVDPDPNQCAQDLYLAALGAISGAPEMYPTWTFVGVDVYVGQDGPDSLVGTYNGNTVGTRTSAPQPPNNCAVLVRKTSGVGGRRNKGRFYFPPMSLGETAVNENGIITGTTLTGLQANFTEWFTALTGSQYDPVILHSSDPALPTPVTGFQVQAQIATQRTRMRK